MRFSNYDVIDSRIDVSTQKALIRLRSKPATSAFGGSEEVFHARSGGIRFGG